MALSCRHNTAFLIIRPFCELLYARDDNHLQQKQQHSGGQCDQMAEFKQPNLSQKLPKNVGTATFT